MQLQDFSWLEIGARIRDWRLAKGMSQKDLASAAGITPPGLFRIEAGDTNPQLQTLQRISKALGFSVRELMCGCNQNDSKSSNSTNFSRILDSGDDDAIGVFWNGVAAAEVILARRNGRSSSSKPAVDRLPNIQELVSQTYGVDLSNWNAAKKTSSVKHRRGRATTRIQHENHPQRATSPHSGMVDDQKSEV